MTRHLAKWFASNPSPSMAMALWLSVISPAWAQGTINASSVAVPSRPRISFSWPEDLRGTLVGGPNYLVEVLAKSPGAAAFAPVLSVKSDGTLQPFVPIPVLGGNNAGLFSGGTAVVPGVAGGSPAVVAIRVWDSTTGATFDEAWMKGITVFDVAALGGAGTPPSTPAILTGYQGFGLVPEPAPIALGLAGLGLLAWARTRR